MRSLKIVAKAGKNIEPTKMAAYTGSTCTVVHYSTALDSANPISREVQDLSAYKSSHATQHNSDVVSSFCVFWLLLTNRLQAHLQRVSSTCTASAH